VKELRISQISIFKNVHLENPRGGGEITLRKNIRWVLRMGSGQAWLRTISTGGANSSGVLSDLRFPRRWLSRYGLLGCAVL
jgi:hypothetical protein